QLFVCLLEQCIDVRRAECRHWQCLQVFDLRLTGMRLRGQQDACGQCECGMFEFAHIDSLQYKKYNNKPRKGLPRHLWQRSPFALLPASLAVLPHHQSLPGFRLVAWLFSSKGVE